MGDNFGMTRRAILLVITTSTRLLTAAPPQTTITVTVKNQYGKPVDNAAVILDFLGSRQITKLGRRKATHWEVRSNQDGVAKFPPVPQGTLQVQVVGKNYQTFGTKLDVDQEQKAVEVVLNPPQKQYSAHDPEAETNSPK